MQLLWLPKLNATGSSAGFSVLVVIVFLNAMKSVSFQKCIKIQPRKKKLTN